LTLFSPITHLSLIPTQVVHFDPNFASSPLKSWGLPVVKSPLPILFSYCPYHSYFTTFLLHLLGRQSPTFCGREFHLIFLFYAFSFAVFLELFSSQICYIGLFERFPGPRFSPNAGTFCPNLHECL